MDFQTPTAAARLAETISQPGRLDRLMMQQSLISYPPACKPAWNDLQAARVSCLTFKARFSNFACNMDARLLRLGMNIWPPFLGAGIHVERFDRDYRHVEVRMRLGLLNRNYFGFHFGGSLYAMTDPFYTLMVQYGLGRAWFVMHAGAQVEYLAPGRGTVRARFEITENQLASIRQATAGGHKHFPEFGVEVRDVSDQVVTRVTHTLYVQERKRRT